MFAITETWLTPLDVVAQLEIVPPGYSFVHRPRTGHVGGGLGLLYKDAIVLSKVEDGEKESFEFSEWRIVIGTFTSRLVLLYRPPYSEEHPVSMATFLSEFSGFMESIILAPEPLIILGDFNIHMHVDRGSDCNDAAQFIEILYFTINGSFKPVSEEDVRALITKAPIKCCPLDPIPSSVLAQLLDVLIPVITTMINLSFETGQFASDWKEALLLPALKKAGLEVAFKNFRPKSNLPFVSKLSE